MASERSGSRASAERRCGIAAAWRPRSCSIRPASACAAASARRVRQGGERVLERAAGAGRGRARARLWRSWLRRPPPGANGLGRVEPGLLLSSEAEIVVGLGEAGLERDRAAETRLGLVEAASLVLRDAEIDVADRIVGRQRYARTSSAAAGSARPCIRSSTPSGARPGRGRAVRPAPHRPRVRPAPGAPPRQGPRRGRGARGARLRPARAGRGAAGGERDALLSISSRSLRMPCPDRPLTRGAGLATVAPHGPGVNRRHPIAAGPGAARRRGRRRARDEMPDFPIVDAHVHLYDPGGDPLPVDGGQGGARGRT